MNEEIAGEAEGDGGRGGEIEEELNAEDVEGAEEELGVPLVGVGDWGLVLLGLEREAGIGAGWKPA